MALSQVTSDVVIIIFIYPQNVQKQQNSKQTVD